MKTKKEIVIGRYCGLLLEPAKEYMECAPRAAFDEKENLYIVFTLRNSKTWTGHDFIVSCGICEVDYFTDRKVLCDQVCGALLYYIDIDKSIAEAKRKIGWWSDQDAKNARSDLQKAINLICQRFHHAAYEQDEDLIAPGF